MNKSKLYEYIAKQLNDHENQCHGVKQGSYTTWSLDHIQDAVQCAIDYVFSINPKAFPTQTLTLTQSKDSCAVSFACVGCKVLEVIRIGDAPCSNVTEATAEETNNLMSMLGSACSTTASSDEPTDFALKKLSDDTYLSDSVIAKGTSIEFLCAGSTDDAPPSFLSEYSSLIKNYALWQLLLTDNESRTNPLRWQAYFDSLKWFVETKLLLEFSLQEKDYLLGRRLVDDR